MSSDAKATIWCFAIVALLVTVIVVTIGFYYHGKDQRQAARGKANVDVVCTVKTPPA